MTAHFIQADTIVPEAGSPKAYDRYGYANNNPVRYNDPSGHSPVCILGGVNGCLQWAGLTGVNAAAGMERYSNDIHANISMYGIDASGVRLTNARKALLAIAASANAVSSVNGLPPQQALNKATGNFSIYESYDPSFRGFAPPSMKMVFIGQNSSITNIVHEIAHRVDFYGSNGNPDEYKSFIEMNSPECKPGIVGCLNNSASNLYAFANLMSGGSPRGTYYMKTGTYSTWYGQNSSIDDFAESFTVFVRNTTNLGMDVNIDVDPTRLALIVDSIK